MKHLKHLSRFLFDHLEYIFIIALFVGIFYLALSQGSYSRAHKSRLDDPNYYPNKIFDDSYVHRIDVQIAGQDYTNLLAAPREKTKYRTSITIDGETFSDVAFSIRGNGSVETIADNPYTNRFNYTLNFQKYNDASYYGLDKLVLSSLYFEPSYLRSYLAFKLTAAAGAEAPLAAFTEFYINGELQGLYLAIEAIDGSFLARTGNSSDAALFHPGPYDADWDRVYEDRRRLTEDETDVDTLAHPDSSQNTYGGSDLTYRGAELSHYNSIFLNATTKYSSADAKLIVDGLEALSEFSLNNPADYWDIEAVIKFFAAAALVPNSDSYLGVLAQNYYLRLSNAKLSVISWDYDRAFKYNGFAVDMQEDDPVLFWPIDTPTIATESSSRPLWMLVAQNDTYLAAYHNAIQAALDTYLLNGNCRRDYDRTVELIRSYVYSDPTRPNSVEQFENEVNYLRDYISLRADSIQKQLWGLEPRTREE